MIETGGGLFAVLLLVLANGFFVAAEFALVTVRKTRVEQLVAERRPGAGNVAHAVHHLDSYIAACQLGITMASLALGWVGEPALHDIIVPVFGAVGAHAVAVPIIFVLITALHVVAGELTPKGLALQYPERTAMVVAAPLRLFQVVFRPAIWLLNESGWLLARLIGVSRQAGHEPHIGAEELRLVVQASAEAGAIETGEQFLIERVLRFGDLTVAEVMVPRTEVVAMPVTTSTAEAMEILREHHHSRYPVYRGAIDDVVGVLHVRDLMLAEPGDSLEPLIRETLVVPSQATVERLLTEMRARRMHFAVAVDEYGVTDCIVTLENVLEAIVGELQDEFEEPERAVEQRPGGVLRIDGLDNVDVLPELLGVEVPEGPYNTVAGYVLHLIGRIPSLGEGVEVGEYRLEVVEMDDLRIATVEAKPLGAAARAQEVVGEVHAAP